MTLKQLEYFLTIAETGNMTQAARMLNISQPPLSLQLKALEDELGVALFERKKKTLIITTKGEILQNRARKILNMIDDTIYELQRLEHPRVPIRLGTISSVGSKLLPEKILQFGLKFPYVDFQIFEGSTSSILEQLDNGRIDIGMVREPFNGTCYGYTPIVDSALGYSQCDYFVALAKPKFYDNPDALSLPLTDLHSKPLIIHQRYMPLLGNTFRKKGISPHIVCQNNTLASSLSWAAAGIGIALLPSTSAALHNSPDLITQLIVEPSISSSAFVVWKKGMSMSREAASFIELFSKNHDIPHAEL